MLRTVVELLCRSGLDEAATELLGAVTRAGVGHEVVGDDDLRLSALRRELSGRVPGDRFDQLIAQGALLDDAAAASVATAAFDELTG
jgi:hypothetical protein